MRSNLLCGRGGVSHVVDEDTRHSLPIAQMGNYQDYLKKQPVPLRELESPPVRQHMFGNPYKTNKNLMMMTDEVGFGDVDEVQIMNSAGQNSHQSQGQVMRGVKRPAGDPLSAPPKRRKGPLPKDFKYQSPSSSPVHKIEYPSVDIKPESNDVKPVVMLLNTQQQAQLPLHAPQLTQPPQQQLHHHQFNGHNKPVVSPMVQLHGKMAGYISGEYHLSTPVEPSERTTLRNSIEENNPVIKEEPLPVVRPVNSITNHKLENFKNNFLKKANMPNSHGNLGVSSKNIADTILSNMTEMHSPGNSWLHHNGQVNSNDLHQVQKTSLEHSFSLNQAKTLIPTTYNTTIPLTNSETCNSDSDKVPLISSQDSKSKSNQRVGSISPDPSVTVTTVTNGPNSLAKEEKILTADELRSIKLRNNNVRQLIYKEVKKPGKLHTDLWKMLDSDLHGPPWIRRQFIQEVKLEALR